MTALMIDEVWVIELRNKLLQSLKVLIIKMDERMKS